MFSDSVSTNLRELMCILYDGAIYHWRVKLNEGVRVGSVIEKQDMLSNDYTSLSSIELICQTPCYH